MIEAAKAKHGNNITPAQKWYAIRKNWSKAFTTMNGELVLWYNDAKHDSTHIIMQHNV
jgi:hypothetical protein